MNQLSNFQRKTTIGFNKYSFSQNDILGKGATGYVYKGRKFIKSGIRISDGMLVAIKTIDMNQNQNQITRSLLQSQKKALQMLSRNGSNNPHVLKLFDIINENNCCYIVSQYCGNITLKDYLQQKGMQISKNLGRLTQEEAHQIFKKILLGYCSIIDACIIHRDLKPANIMMKKKNEDTKYLNFQKQQAGNLLNKFNSDSSLCNFDPVIIDFGFCEVIKQKTTMTAYNVGSPTYMSPQAYLKTLYSQKSDVWSLGVILYQMITGKTPDLSYPTKDIKQYFQSIKQKNESLLKLIKYQPTHFNLVEFSPLTEQLLQSCLKIIPHQRNSCHKLKYIIDKEMINKLNNKNISTLKPKSSVISANNNQNYSTKNSNCFDFSSTPSNMSLSGHYQKFTIESRNKNPLFNSIQKIQPQQKKPDAYKIKDENQAQYKFNNDHLRLSSNFSFLGKLAQSRYKLKHDTKTQNCQNKQTQKNQNLSSHLSFNGDIPKSQAKFEFQKSNLAPSKSNYNRYGQFHKLQQKKDYFYQYNNPRQQNIMPFNDLLHKQKQNIDFHNQNVINPHCKTQNKIQSTQIKRNFYRYPTVVEQTKEKSYDQKLRCSLNFNQSINSFNFAKKKDINLKSENSSNMHMNKNMPLSQHLQFKQNQKYFSFKNNNVLEFQPKREGFQLNKQKNLLKAPFQVKRENKIYCNSNNTNIYNQVKNLTSSVQKIPNQSNFNNENHYVNHQIPQQNVVYSSFSPYNPPLMNNFVHSRSPPVPISRHNGQKYVQLRL